MKVKMEITVSLPHGYKTSEGCEDYIKVMEILTDLADQYTELSVDEAKILETIEEDLPPIRERLLPTFDGNL